MSSTVKSRPNHYERLGLKPSASAEEVGRAFAREIGLFRPRPFGGVAELGLAYETLRDPAKRRAYDESIGLHREPPSAPMPPRPYVTNAIFIRPPGHASPLLKPAAAAAAEPARTEPVAPPAAPELAAVEPAPPSFLIAPDRPASTPEPVEAALSRLLPKLAMRPSPTADKEDDSPIELNRTLAIAGSLVLAVGVLGAWAGSQAGQAAQDSQPANAVTMPVPKAKPAAAAAEPVGPAAPVAAPPRFERAPSRGRPATTVAAEPAVPELTQPSRSVAEQNRFARESIAQATAAEPLALEETPAPVAASIPLSDATVARTIQRIGYSCGKVASTVAGETPGVFTVTCSSGQTFQAKPLRGRYHFRRIGR